VAQVKQYKGKLGFEHRSEEKLTLALTELLDTLEEFGHPALQINARDPHRIGLDADQYQISLRLRRIPLRLGVRTPPGVPAPTAYIELAMAPCFPDACDQEVSEILLAMILKRLTEALNPLLIFWQETNKALTPNQFLGAFAPMEAPVTKEMFASAAMVDTDAKAAVLAADTLLEQVVADAATAQKTAASASLTAQPMVTTAPAKPTQGPILSAATSRLLMADRARAEAEAERARGQARFGSADAATPVLEQQCDALQDTPRRIKPRAKTWRKLPVSEAPYTSYRTVFGQSRLNWIFALPRWVLSMTGNAIRSVDLVLSVRALLTGMAILFLHGSGMVQAAARVLLPH
jgi:hypothetical protein